MAGTWQDLNLFEKAKRWMRARIELLEEVDALRKENAILREKIAALQRAKEQAERQVQERRREKEALRSRLANQKESVDSANRVTEQLSAKVTELRDENAALRQRAQNKPKPKR